MVSVRSFPRPVVRVVPVVPMLFGALLLARQSRPTFRSGTDVVRLEVTVLDKDRHPVRGLTARDFTVFEEGRDRPIVAFTPVELPAEPAATPAKWLRDAPRDVATNTGPAEGRLVIIAFDWSIRFMDQAAARRVAYAAVENLGPSDEASVIFTSRFSSVGTPQNFTADRARLRATIERPFGVAQTKMVPPSNELESPEGFENGDCLCRTCSMEVLTAAAGALREVSRRPKVVLFITSYYRFLDTSAPTKTPPIVPGKMWTPNAQLPGVCAVPLRNARQNLEAAMGDANAVVHVIDAVGLETAESAPLGPSRIMERQDGLPALADMTGGRAVMNTNTPESAIPSIFAETGAYYVMGFTPTPGTKPNQTRRVSVRVKGRDLTIRARDRFTTTPDTTGPDSALTASIGGALPATDVPLSVAAAPVITTGTRKPAVVVVGRMADISTAVQAPTSVTMLTAAFTPRAVPVAAKRRTLELAPMGSGSNGARGLVAGLPVEPGPYELRVAIQLSSGRAGSVNTFVDVPDFARERLTMSGLLISLDPPEPAIPQDEIENMLPVTPTARRDFRRTETVSAFVQISQGTSRDDVIQPVLLRVKVVDARDAVMRDQALTLTPSEFLFNRTATPRLTVPVAELPSGDYLLTLEATSAEKTVARTLRFRVIG